MVSPVDQKPHLVVMPAPTPEDFVFETCYQNWEVSTPTIYKHAALAHPVTNTVLQHHWLTFITRNNVDALKLHQTIFAGISSIKPVRQNQKSKISNYIKYIAYYDEIALNQKLRNLDISSFETEIVLTIPSNEVLSLPNSREPLNVQKFAETFQRYLRHAPEQTKSRGT